jgi:hypothetical protein
VSGLRKIVHRICLRLLHGRDAWHQRHFRPEVQVVQSSDRLWFEEAGAVVEAYPLTVLNGRFSGRCNLLLSGPSVRQIRQPERLAACDWVGVNGSPSLFGEHVPEMRVYHVNDTSFIRGNLDKFLRFAERAEFTVIDYRAMFALLRLARGRMPATRLVVYDAWNLPFRNPLGKIEQLAQPPAHRNVHWSPDLHLGLAPGGTVAYTAAQLAWHGGYRSLYIFGLDLSNSGRFYHEDKPQPQMLDKAYADVIVPAFELMSRETKGKMRVLNCNPQSRLPGDIIEKIDAEAALAQAPPREQPEERS